MHLQSLVIVIHFPQLLSALDFEKNAISTGRKTSISFWISPQNVIGTHIIPHLPLSPLSAISPKKEAEEPNVETKPIGTTHPHRRIRLLFLHRKAPPSAQFAQMSFSTRARWQIWICHRHRRGVKGRCRRGWLGGKSERGREKGKGRGSRGTWVSEPCGG